MVGFSARAKPERRSGLRPGKYPAAPFAHARPKQRGIRNVQSPKGRIREGEKVSRSSVFAIEAGGEPGSATPATGKPVQTENAHFPDGRFPVRATGRARSVLDEAGTQGEAGEIGEIVDGEAGR